MQATHKLKQSLQQKIAPTQIQYWQLLSYSQHELEAKVDKEVEENIALVEKEDRTYVKDNHIASSINPYFFDKKGQGEIRLREDIPFSFSKPWREKLLDQLHLLKLSAKMQKIGEHLIGSLDDRGYLSSSFPIIASEMSVLYNMEVSDEEVAQALDSLHQLEPTGVGARSLQEALILQLQKKEETPIIRQAIDMLTNSFPYFVKRDYGSIMKKGNLTSSQLTQVLGEIKKLYPEPIPCNNEETPPALLQADFLLKRVKHKMVIELPKNRAATLKVHNQYEELIQAYQDAREQDKKLAMQFIQRSITRAQHFIEALKQRHKTLLRVMKTIVKVQYHFFEEEDEKKLVPMSLQDIADAIKMDESTISRAVSGKSIQTDHQVYQLKFFFSEGIKTKEGNVVSSRKVKKILAEVIEQENKAKPYSDEKLTAIIQEKGFLIARRTIAKYRQKLGIPSSNLRKNLFSTN